MKAHCFVQGTRNSQRAFVESEIDPEQSDIKVNVTVMSESDLPAEMNVPCLHGTTDFNSV